MTRLTDYFEVEPLGDDRFAPGSGSPLARRTLFGGALVGQALRSASLTVADGMHPQSLHASFVRAAVAGQETAYVVERVKDGRAVSNRRVTAVQGERIVMTLTAAFGVDEPGDDYEPPRPAAAPLPPDAADRPADSFGAVVVDVSDPTADPAAYRAWARSVEPLPDDRVLQCCAVAYLADAGPPAVSATAIGVEPGGPGLEHGTVMTTSLDHAVWFHRPGRVDDWCLITGDPVSTALSRGLMSGVLYDARGVHVASYLQSMLIRQ